MNERERKLKEDVEFLFLKETKVIIIRTL